MDRFASRFVGARGKSPGTFANLVERRPRFQCPLLRMFHHDEIPQKKKGYTRFVAISDTHCMHETVRIPPGDVLVHCGDILFLDSLYRSETSATRLRAFDRWIGSLPHDRKIVIGGNHDACLEEMDTMSVRGLLKHCTYLENEHVTLAESGLRVRKLFFPRFCIEREREREKGSGGMGVAIYDFDTLNTFSIPSEHIARRYLVLRRVRQMRTGRSTRPFKNVPLIQGGHIFPKIAVPATCSFSTDHRRRFRGHTSTRSEDCRVL